MLAMWTVMGGKILLTPSHPYNRGGFTPFNYCQGKFTGMSRTTRDNSIYNTFFSSIFTSFHTHNFTNYKKWGNNDWSSIVLSLVKFLHSFIRKDLYEYQLFNQTNYNAATGVFSQKNKDYSYMWGKAWTLLVFTSQSRFDKSH